MSSVVWFWQNVVAELLPLGKVQLDLGSGSSLGVGFPSL